MKTSNFQISSPPTIQPSNNPTTPTDPTIRLTIRPNIQTSNIWLSEVPVSSSYWQQRRMWRRKKTGEYQKEGDRRMWFMSGRLCVWVSVWDLAAPDQSRQIQDHPHKHGKRVFTSHVSLRQMTTYNRTITNIRKEKRRLRVSELKGRVVLTSVFRSWDPSDS